MNILVNNLKPILDRSKQEHYFLELIKSKWILCWTMEQERKAICHGIHPSHFTPESLKEIKVWDKLSKEIQGEVEAVENSKVIEVKQKMEKARESRKSKYPDIPKQMTCISCGAVVDVVPSAVAAKCQSKDILLVDYIKGFECRECNPPKRGRTIDSKFAHLPKEVKLICSRGCGNEKIVKRTYISGECKKLGISPEKYIKEYVCKICKPSKRGYKRKGKVLTDQENPNKIQCSICKEWKGTTAIQVNEIAKREGLTSKQVL